MKFNFIGLKIKDKRIRLFGKVYTIPALWQFVFIIVAGLSCVIIGLIINSEHTTRTPNSVPTHAVLSNTATPEKIEIDNSVKKHILIHISGAVAKPGLVSVEENARLADVIDAAGGLLDDCDLTSVNLASFVTDGSKIYIPRIGETPLCIPPVQTPSKEALKININTAELTQLTKLSGIGESTAKKIIAYREEHGNFKKIEDLLLVSGIGKAKFNIIKNDICV